MPDRTVNVLYYTQKDGTVHQFGEKVSLSDDDAKRGDALGAFKESEPRDASEGLRPDENLNVHVPATHRDRDDLTGTRLVVPELENSEPDKDPDLPQDPEEKPGDEAPADEFDSSGEVSRKAPAASKKDSKAKASSKASS
jgi:hypothetical protein